MKFKTLVIAIGLLLCLCAGLMAQGQTTASRTRRHSAAWYRTHRRHSAAWYRRHRRHSAAWYRTHRRHSAAWYRRHRSM